MGLSNKEEFQKHTSLFTLIPPPRPREGRPRLLVDRRMGYTAAKHQKSQEEPGNREAALYVAQDRRPDDSQEKARTESQASVREEHQPFHAFRKM